MRLPILLSLGLGLVAAVAAGADDRPIPQDRERIEQRSKNWLAWNRRTLGAEYERTGRKNGRWDKPAREALELMARRFSYQDPPPAYDEINRLARQAVGAGCDDPLILYIDAATSSRSASDPKGEELAGRWRRAGEAMMRSDYSPFRRAMAYLRGRTAQGYKPDQMDDAAKRQLAKDLDVFVALIGPSAKVDPRGEFWDERWTEALWTIYHDYRNLNGKDSKAAFERLDALLAPVPGLEALRLTFKGKFLIDYAWEARSDKLAALVTEDQFARFRERLTQAKEAFEAAYKLNPNQPEVGRRMIVVAMGLGEDRDFMETWFERAITRNPNDEDACMAKMEYLAPKWHGDPDYQDVLAFGLACSATKNWRGGLNLLGPEAIYRRAMAQPTAQRKAFLRQAKTRAVIRSSFDEYLKRLPLDYPMKSKYAYLMFLAGEYKAADALFKELGDHLSQWTGAYWEPVDRLKQMRDKVAEHVAGGGADEPPTPPGTKPGPQLD